MNERLEKCLQEEFPNLYKDLYGPMNETTMHWGFTCNDGWFILIWKLSEKLEKLIIKWKEENPDNQYIPKAAQVKEKFGLLRFYMDNETDEMDKIIIEYENLSGKICENCGMPGKLSNSSWWLKTLCPECENKRNEKNKNS